MRRDNKFRFSLQWRADTEEKILVGSLLDRLGKKKSDFIVQAVSEYIQRHPELEAAGANIRITYHPVQTQEQLMETVRAAARGIVDEYLAGRSLPAAEVPPAEEPQTLSDQDLDDMVAGLQLFDV